jgi:hypothetical protein
MHLPTECSVIIKVLYSRLLLYANAVVQHYHAGIQSGKSTTEYKIIRNEIYVMMEELDFPTKLKRLTNATLTTVLHQNTEQLFGLLKYAAGA